jgi:1-acyl-sn-glycerol-3-phosphate acyltransferase
MMGGYDVAGREHIPRAGPFIVFANHQSYVEPLLIPGVSPRMLHAMAKSTQFDGRFFGWLMPRLGAFPVRRFEPDPQAVRMVLRYLAAGEGVLIFIEGERTWDGTLQPPRLGTVRLALKAGVPIIPCRVDGAYEAWPRWDRKFRRHRIRIEFQPSLQLPQVDSKREREAQVAEAADQIMAALR